MVFEVLTAFEPTALAAFIVASWILIVTPGIDFMFIVASSVAGGPRRGVGASVGVNLGVIVHVISATVGVSALLLAYPAAYDAIRYAGAAYLVFLAIQSWRTSTQTAEGTAQPSIRKTILRGFMTNVLNPKTALFIFAFIPQFTDPAIGPVWLQILILGLIFQINGFIFTLGLAVAAGRLSQGLRARTKLLNKLSAIIFGGLATRLILD